MKTMLEILECAAPSLKAAATGISVPPFRWTAMPSCLRLLVAVVCLGATAAVHAGPDPARLGTTNLVEGLAAGSDSVILLVSSGSAAWTAVANEPWLHVNPANASGAITTNIFFTYDANTTATRSGTLTIDGQTLTVTQAGLGYAPLTAPLTLEGAAAGLINPSAVAVDGSGNLYFADSGNDAVYELPNGSATLVTLANGSAGLNSPEAVAVDRWGNVYIADNGADAVFELPQGGSALTTLADVSSGLYDPTGVAVDAAGNIYVTDQTTASLYELPSGGGPMFTLVSSGLRYPAAVAVDVVGNIYISDPGNQAIYELPVGTAALITLASGQYQCAGVAVDGSGNVYSVNTSAETVYKLPPGGTALVPVVYSGLGSPNGVALDGSGNIYIADEGYPNFDISPSLFELPRVFVSPASVSESQPAGNDILPGVVPSTADLSQKLAPVSDSPWLTITATNGGVVSFSFTANAAPDRTAHIDLLGQDITIHQVGITALGTTALVEGPAAGNDSVVLSASPNAGPWTAAANDSWLHLNPANVAGAGSTNVLFSFDVNPGVTRTGTLTIDGLTATVSQAGSTYTPVTALTTLAGTASGLNAPVGVAVDGSGNVYIADENNDAVYQLPVGGSRLTTLASGSSGLQFPTGVAADAAGDIFIADGTSTVFALPYGGSTLATLLQQSSIRPYGVGVDGAGNVYVADNNNAMAYELPAGGSTPIRLLPPNVFFTPGAVAADAAGNVYIADNGLDAVLEMPNGSSALIPLANSSSGLVSPVGVAVDGAGNVYIADSVYGAVFELPAGGSALLTVAGGTSGLVSPAGVAVDGLGDLFIADTGAQKVFELPRAFVDATPRSEFQVAGSDSLPVVLPASANLSGALAPQSSQPWLTVDNTNLGVLTFTYTANTAGLDRTADLTILGAMIPITQAITNPPPFAATMNVLRTAGLTVKISLSDLATNWTDSYSLPVTLTAIDLTSTNGQTVYPLNLTFSGGAYVISASALLGYVNAANVGDQISYTISDPEGDTATGLINIIVSTNPKFGQAKAVVPQGLTATVNFAGQPGYNYTILRSTNLFTGTGWVPLETTNAPPAGPFSYVDMFTDLGGTPPGSAYYRLSWNPVVERP